MASAKESSVCEEEQNSSFTPSFLRLGFFCEQKAEFPIFWAKGFLRLDSKRNNVEIV